MNSHSFVLWSFFLIIASNANNRYTVTRQLCKMFGFYFCYNSYLYFYNYQFLFATFTSSLLLTSLESLHVHCHDSKAAFLVAAASETGKDALGKEKTCPRDFIDQLFKYQTIG